MVFAFSGHGVWVTTSRGSVKARAWRRDPYVAGLVRTQEAAVFFTGAVKTYDALDPGTWGASIVRAPILAAATMRFSRKNARFFAGYAVDARQVPLAWTPPGRVFARVEIQRLAMIDDRGIAERVGDWSRRTADRAASFRVSSKPADPLAGLPAEVADRLGRSGGEAALAIEGPGGEPLVLPAHWIVTEHEVYAAIPSELAELAGEIRRVALATDRASWWRARDMAGTMIQGEGRAVDVGRLTSGSGSAARIARSAGIESPNDSTLVRIVPSRIVWWLGWSSGTAAA
jgi:hypothetical protein